MIRASIAALAATLLIVSTGNAQNPASTAPDSTMGDSTRSSMSHESMADDMTGGPSVAELVFCTSVEDRQPMGESTNFGADVGSVTCFTRITGIEGESSVTHAWYHGDQEMGRVELPVRSSMWRTWSTKSIPLDADGQWRVDVLSAGGDVLKSATFTVGASGGM